jgi:hypothetical protein
MVEKPTIGAPELEVTNEMVRAGVKALYDEFPYGWDLPSGDELGGIIVAVYRAMLSKREIDTSTCSASDRSRNVFLD